MAGLLDGVPDRANPEAYAVKVHDLARGNALHAAARCACASIEQGESVDDVFGRLQQKELELIRANTRGARAIRDAALDFLNQFYVSCDAEGPDIKLTTSLLDLDAKTGGLQPGTLVIVGGRTGGGKSSFLQQVAFAQAKDNLRVYFASLEMTEKVVLTNGVSMLTDIPTNTVLNPRYLAKYTRRPSFACANTTCCRNDDFPPPVDRQQVPASLAATLVLASSPSEEVVDLMLVPPRHKTSN